MLSIGPFFEIDLFCSACITKLL
ncbi:protein of unknown function [Burkholderia multivorans]